MKMTSDFPERQARRVPPLWGLQKPGLSHPASRAIKPFEPTV